MNFLNNYETLNNHYFALRHGESLANVEGIIISKPRNGVQNYGLSNEGRQQVERSVKKIKSINELNARVRIISSDFKRAYESARIAHQLLVSKHPLELDAKLRERDFGDFELGDNKNYHTVWNNDAVDSSHTFDNVESADSVMSRATSLIVLLEESYSEQYFLLVAHGDTIQILQTAFQKQLASKQRELLHLETAEIRKLVLRA